MPSGKGRMKASSGRGKYLYFIQAESGGPVKIGVAYNPRERLGLLQTGNPERLVIRRAVPFPAYWHAEQILHEQFAAHRLVGEWFEPVPALLERMDDPRLDQIVEAWIKENNFNPELSKGLNFNPATDECRVCGVDLREASHEGAECSACIEARPFREQEAA